MIPNTTCDRHVEHDQQVRIPAGTAQLWGILNVPPEPKAIVLFAHGSGSGRHSPRNHFMARKFQDAGMATLLFDLLTESEEAADRYTADYRFDIPFLAERLVHATDWAAEQPQTFNLPVGYFGASTGGAAAIVAATLRSERVGAVVCRGARADLAGDALAHLAAPTLLIVGGNDTGVLPLNIDAFSRIATPEKRLTVVPYATHLFEEPGKLEAVAMWATDWLEQHLGRRPAAAALAAAV